MNTLAVINCKKQKQTYECPASEMYEPSAMFRAMRDFVKEYYTHYVILSAEYGVVEPDTIIAPYSKAMGTGGYSGTGESNILSPTEKEQWAHNVINSPVWAGYDSISFHVGSNYWDPIKHHFTGAEYITLPPNTGFVVRHYQWLLRDLHAGKPIDFTFRARDGMANHPSRIWYHPVYGEFEGNEWSLYQKYNELQNLDLPT